MSNRTIEEQRALWREKRRIAYQRNRLKELERIRLRRKTMTLEETALANLRQRQRYHKSKTVREKNRDRKYRLRQSFRIWSDALKNKPCTDCKRSFHPFVMDFDHRPGTNKLDHVSKLVSSNFSKTIILKEISKCDLVCANCHRMRTYNRRQSS